MVEIAKALLLRSKILIMDEPTATLTSEEIRKLFVIIRDLKESGVTVIYIFIVLIVLCQLLVSKTRFGRNVMFMGSNPTAANLSGINVRLNTVIVFLLSGMISALSGVILASRVMSANPQAGSGYELDAIASCVVGGISMRGGVGSFVNTLIGVAVIGILGNALNLMGVGTYMQMIIRGTVIAAAVTLDIYNKNRRRMGGL
jgi:ribose/xylose/arabinose/galactoside ABC-type transport system permease subunit